MCRGQTNTLSDFFPTHFTSTKICSHKYIPTNNRLVCLERSRPRAVIKRPNSLRRTARSEGAPTRSMFPTKCVLCPCLRAARRPSRRTSRTINHFSCFSAYLSFLFLSSIDFYDLGCERRILSPTERLRPSSCSFVSQEPDSICYTRSIRILKRKAVRIIADDQTLFVSELGPVLDVSS